MNKENQEKRVDKKLIREFKTTKEYKTWFNSLFAIIGYISNEELDDLNLMLKLIADHLNASVELQNGLENTKIRPKKDTDSAYYYDCSE